MAKDISCVSVDDPNLSKLFRPFALKMEQQGLPAIVINTFKCYFNQFLYGAQGKLSDRDVLAVHDDELADYDSMEQFKDKGEKALDKTAVIKLNGGLGTSMGLESAKSLIPVKDGLSFLDLILLQAKNVRAHYGVDFPQVFMNSFKTHMDTMLQIGDFHNGTTGIDLAFLQHRYPKIVAKDHTPASWPQNPELEWNPPGHGDIYTAELGRFIRGRLDVHPSFHSHDVTRLDARRQLIANDGVESRMEILPFLGFQKGVHSGKGRRHRKTSAARRAHVSPTFILTGRAAPGEDDQPVVPS